MRSNNSYKNYLSELKSINVKRKREDDDLHKKTRMLKAKNQHRSKNRLFDFP
jgi:hypothetical protein